MRVTHDIRHDPLAVWDNFEETTLSSTRKDGTMQDLLVSAKRRQITDKEQQPSNGAYQGASTIWLIPQDQITFATLKEGDLVTDDEGVAWTVLQADHAAYRTFWRLTCVALSILYDLADKVDIERAAVAYDAAGSAVKSFPSDNTPGGSYLYRQLLSRVQPTTAEVREERGIRGTEISYQVFLSRPLNGVTTEDRVKWGTKYLEIRGYQNPEKLDELPMLLCELVP